MEKLWSSEGRIGRMQYFLRLVLSTLIFYVASVLIMSVLVIFNNEQAAIAVYYIFTTLTAIFQILQAIKRTHDCGWSGHFCWFLAVPALNIGYALVLLIRPGDETANKYGEPVK